MSDAEPPRAAQARQEVLVINCTCIEPVACILGLDERNRPVYQMLSLHVLFKPAKALSISCACIERLTCPATAKIG